MKVKTYKMKSGREINYYPISEVRKEFKDYLEKNGLNFNFDIDVKDTSTGNLFLKATLMTEKDERLKDRVSVVLPIDECLGETPKYSSPSNEVAKILTRLEKRCKIILLGLEDPDEAKGEIEHIEETINAEEKPKSFFSNDPITPAQLRVIQNFMDKGHDEEIMKFITENFGKVSLKELTKTEAVKVIQLINTYLKKGG